MRVLGLDVGRKTIGIAVSDDSRMIALPLKTIKRSSFARDMKDLEEVIREYPVDMIVVGMPVNMNGTLGPQSEFVEDFINKLKKHMDIPVTAWDERLSTMAVTKVLLEGDVGRAKRKEVVDKMAAAYILQGYLDCVRRRDS